MANERYDFNPTDTQVVTFTPVLDTAIYAANDILFVSTEVSNVFNRYSGVANLQSVLLYDAAAVTNTTLRLVFSTAALTTTLNANFSTITDAENKTVVGVISDIAYADRIDLSAGYLYQKTSCGLLMHSSSTSTSLWVTGIVTAGTPTYSADSIQIKLGFI